MSDLSGETSWPLAEAAYRRLRDDILACRRAPGQRVTERRLASDMGVGVSPVRDALTRLDHEGLVRTIPRKGYQITPVTLKSVDDLFSFWSIIGPEVVKLGVEKASREQLNAIADYLNELESVGQSTKPAPDVLHVVDVGGDLFAALAEATGNAYLAAAYARLSGELLRVLTLIGSVELVVAATEFKARTWLQAIEVRDGERLAEHARDYIRVLSDHVARTLVRWPSVMTTEVVPIRQP
jgi:DNA-binding GntR family transcriptional regulator